MKELIKNYKLNRGTKNIFPPTHTHTQTHTHTHTHTQRFMVYRSIVHPVACLLLLFMYVYVCWEGGWRAELKLSGLF